MFADSFECFAKDNDGIVIGRLSGLRQVAIVTLLRPFLDSPGELAFNHQKRKEAHN